MSIPNAISAITAAIDKLKGDIEVLETARAHLSGGGIVLAEAQPDTRRRSKRVAKAAPVATTAQKRSKPGNGTPTKRAAPAMPKGPVCSKCHKAGHNARTCGKASAKPASDDDEEGEDAAPPQPAPPARAVVPLDDEAREERRLALREAVADREARREQLRRERDKRSASYVRRHGRPRKGEERVVIDPDSADDDDEPRAVTDDVLQQIPVLKTYVL
jgi:hypothetical protein